MKTFTVTIDDHVGQLLDDCKQALGKTSRAEVFQIALAILKVAVDAHRNGQKLVVADEDDTLKKEILIPGPRSAKREGAD